MAITFSNDSTLLLPGLSGMTRVLLSKMWTKPEASPFGETFGWLRGKVTDLGRAMHRQWVRESLTPSVADEALLDLLVVATDVYTWKLLRLDLGLSRADVEGALVELITELRGAQ